MFKSRYNIEVEGEAGELLLFNAASGAFVVLRGGAKIIYNRYKQGDFSKAKNINSRYGIIEDDMDFLFDIDPCENMDFGLDFGQDFDFPTNKLIPGKAYVDKLIEDGFITLLNPDEELQIQQEYFNNIKRNSKEFTICLAPSYKCNHACPYCDVRKHNGKNSLMSKKIIEQVLAFILKKYQTNPFEKLTVQWYGGDPALCIDLIEYFSEKLIPFCISREIVYDSTILTSYKSITSNKAIDLLEKCGISRAQISVDDINVLRGSTKSKRGKIHTFSDVMKNIRDMNSHGIEVQIVCNTDGQSWPVFLELRKKLSNEGINLTSSIQSNNYGSFGLSACRKQNNDFLNRDEFWSACRKIMFESKNRTSAIQELLHPCGKFCHGQIDNYLAVDAIGDVYKCDGFVGDTKHKKFNILNGVNTSALEQITFNATTDEKCSQCKLMPVCQGSCYWERTRVGTSCDLLFRKVSDYLRYYRKMFGKMGYNEYIRMASSMSDSEVASKS